MVEEMDLSDDLDEILFLLEDNVFVRWRIDYNFFNQSIYGRLFERGNQRFRDFRHTTLPEIKGEPNTGKLLKTGFYQKVKGATSSSTSQAAQSDGGTSLATIRRRRHNRSSLIDMLQQREQTNWRPPSKCYVNNMFLPNSVAAGAVLVDDKLKYCSVYSPDNGRHLLVASLDGHISVFNTEQRYKEVSRYYVDQSTYSILDLDVSPDGREFVCSSWKNLLFTCNVLEEDDINRNYIKSHQLVETMSKMGTFSCCFSNDAAELLASSNDGCIYLFDRNRDQRSLRIAQDLRDDINAVRFLDKTSNNVILGGSNSGIIEVWDRRTIGNEKNQKSVGTLVGHHDGITYIDPKGDGRYFITNSKDQSIKLWDVRKMGKKNQIKKARKTLASSSWNYLSDNIPVEYYGEKKPMDGDCSVMTYRGHRIMKTLIRAKLSPLETTGNRFIYTGCSTGRIIIYDTLTGRMAGKVDGHTDLVRDVSWHPLRAEIASASFDDKVHLNIYTEKIETKAVEPRRSRRIAEKRARVAT